MDIPQPIIDLRSLEIIRGKRVWKPFMQKYNCQKICEIGVFAGRNFIRMIEHVPEIAVAIDAWMEDGNPAHNDSGYSQKELDREYERFIARTADKPFVKIFREYSLEAVKHFPNRYFDLIYIDADHTYKGCLDDIENWYPKLKKGGFLIGDDYVRTVNPVDIKYEVKRAVNNFAKKNSLSVYEIPGNEWATGWTIIKP